MLWNKRGGLPKDVYDELNGFVAKPQVLAWATAEDAIVVGLPGHLAIRDARGWRVAGWHEVDLARWDSESGILSWAGATGNERVRIAEPGRLPMLLKDRVDASILVSERIRAGNVQVQLTGRRDLTRPHAPLLWRADAVDGRTLDRPGVREAVDQRLAELRADVEDPI